jgi:predicted DNA-binding WGR domain protein
LLALIPLAMQNGCMPLSNVSGAADLVKIVPEKNQARFYRLTLWPNLFGEVSLVREYGRLGQNGGHLRFDLFADEDAAVETYNRLLKQKLRRGYVFIMAPADRASSRHFEMVVL